MAIDRGLYSAPEGLEDEATVGIEIGDEEASLPPPQLSPNNDPPQALRTRPAGRLSLSSPELV